MCTAINELRETDFLENDICELPAIPEAIRELVARFANTDWHIRQTARYGFVELVKHGDVGCDIFIHLELIFL